MLLRYFALLVPFLTFSTSSAIENQTESVEYNADDPYYPSLEWSDAFDWMLFKTLSPKSVNVLVSPTSLKLVLAVLYEASSGSTKKDFEDALQFVSKEVLRQKAKETIESLHENPSSQNRLIVSSRIFLDSRITVKEAFAGKLRQYYKTEVTPANFSDAQTTSTKINNWGSESTMGSVTRLTDPDDLKDMVMLLANAIYFKGIWRHPFPKNETCIGVFYPTPTTKIYLPYMVATNSFYFFESPTLEAKILRLPYKHSKFSMFLLLPLSSGGLKSLIDKIDLTSLHRQLHYMDKRDVLVSIPKFSFKLKASYVDVLRQLGLQKIFQNTASFTGIAQGNASILRQLVVSDILQSTAIDVDEEGSVVVAATEVIIGNKIGVPDDVFNATHPFLFFIQDDNSGTILFLGKVENPLYQELDIKKTDDPTEKDFVYDNAAPAPK